MFADGEGGLLLGEWVLFFGRWIIDEAGEKFGEGDVFRISNVRRQQMRRSVHPIRYERGVHTPSDAPLEIPHLPLRWIPRHHFHYLHHHRPTSTKENRTTTVPVSNGICRTYPQLSLPPSLLPLLVPPFPTYEIKFLFGEAGILDDDGGAEFGVRR